MSDKRTRFSTPQEAPSEQRTVTSHLHMVEAVGGRTTATAVTETNQPPTTRPEWPQDLTVVTCAVKDYFLWLPCSLFPGDFGFCFDPMFVSMTFLPAAPLVKLVCSQTNLLFQRFRRIDCRHSASLTGSYRVAPEIGYSVFSGHSLTLHELSRWAGLPSLTCFLLINFDGDIGETRLAVREKSRGATCGQLPQRMRTPRARDSHFANVSCEPSSEYGEARETGARTQAKQRPGSCTAVPASVCVPEGRLRTCRCWCALRTGIVRARARPLLNNQPPSRT